MLYKLLKDEVALNVSQGMFL